MRFSQSIAALSILALAAGCGADDTGGEPYDAGAPDAEAPDSGGADAGTPPGPEFDPFCQGKVWSDTLAPATVTELSGEYVGVIKGIDDAHPFKAGTLETMKVIPPHPFRLERVRAAFGGDTPGKARIRVMTTFGRTYPGPWPDLKNEMLDVVPPFEIDVPEGDPEKWLEVDVSSAGAFLLPTQHYMIVYEHLEQAPFLALEKVPAGEYSRALLFLPKVVDAYGLADADGTAYNYRLQLVGSTFCEIAEAERSFGEDTTQPWQTMASARVAVSDLNGDGHDDVIVNDGAPHAYFGDGKGHFTPPAFDPFPDVPTTSMLVFADLDNDGDVDAFAASYVGIDNDGDGYGVTDAVPDCNDADAAVHPNAIETTNGYDDDCDGVADDGTDGADMDGDGHSIAQGDCDDTRADVFPGAPELLDSRDNDCDGAVDEDFVDHILLNDGAGHFTVVPMSGVEGIDPTTAAAFGDANGDGFLDLYFGNWLVHYPDDPAVQGRYFTGNGDGTFTDAMASAGLVLPKALSCYGVEWTDYNNDGLQDLHVGNYHLYDDQLWKNDGDGTFTDVAKDVGVAHDDVPSPYPGYPGGHTYGTAWGDFDNDGDIDAYICNLAHPRTQPWADPSMFVVNQGAPMFTFLNEREKYGFIYDEGDVNAAWADFDNDGDLDLAIASLYTGHYSRLYRNDGEKGFVDITYESNTAVHDSVSVAWSDVDEDGDLDLLYADRAGLPQVHLFVNRLAPGNSWIQLDLQGTTTNRDAIGARVSLTAGGVTQLRDVHGGEGQSNIQQTRIVHFGLGKNTSIDSVTVRWVGGVTETITGLAPNKRFKVVEGSGQGVPVP